MLFRSQSHATSNVNNIAQKAALAAVTGPLDAVDKMLEAFVDRRKTMVKILNDIEGFHCPMPKGAFYAYVDVTRALGKEIGGQRVDTSAELAAVILEKAQVAVVPGEAFGKTGYIRLSYALGINDLVEGVSRIQKLINS